MNWQLKSILNKATEHLDITLAVVGRSLSIPLTIYYGANYGDGFTLDGLLSFAAIDDGVLREDYRGGFLGPIRPRLEWNTKRCES